MPTPKEQLEKYLAAQKLQRLKDHESGAHQLSTHARQARAEIGRAAMPPAEKNDTDAGEGARQKLPIRYD